MNHLGTRELETQRLILRRFEVTDADTMFSNWANDPEVSKFLTWETHKDVSETVELLKLWAAGYEDEKVYNWVIELKEIGEVIGGISIVKLENEHQACETGYCISKSYWNKGITTEAFNRVIQFLFEEVELNRICARHDLLNEASGAVMKKCGMQYEGTMREVQRIKGKFCTLSMYSILRSDWEGK